MGALHLIALITNLALFHRVGWTAAVVHPPLTAARLVLVAAVAGGLARRALAKWAPVIRGHGIPEAMEAVLTKQSRIAPAHRRRQAAVGRDRHRHRRSVRCRGSDHRHRRRDRLAARPDRPRVAERTQDPARIAARRPAWPRRSARRWPRSSSPSSCCCSSSRPAPSCRWWSPSSIAGGVHAALFGTGPLFTVPHHDFAGLGELPLFALLGLACGLLAVVISQGPVPGRGRLPPAAGQRVLAPGDRRGSVRHASGCVVPARPRRRLRPDQRRCSPPAWPSARWPCSRWPSSSPGGSPSARARRAARWPRSS